MTILKTILSVTKLFIPPILVAGVKGAVAIVAGERKTLFDGDSAAFERIVAGAAVYGEYGVGRSTDHVAYTRDIPIVAVETSKAWADLVRERYGHQRRIDIRWIDVGPVGVWGRPMDYARRRRFEAYIEGPWRGDQTPDVVLVDGRFRVACFLQSLLSARPGATILFDDYRDRPHYHVVEEFVAPSEWCGRQAIFRVPERLDRDGIAREMARFIYVTD